MATFSVALLIILIGIVLSASSVRGDEHQNETENGEDIKHLFGTDGIRDNQIALADKISETEAKLENQIENVFTKLRDNQNALAEKMTEIEAKLEQIESGKRDNQNGLATKLENEIRDNHQEPSPMKNNSTLAGFNFHSLPIFRWNATDCHPGIVINKSTNAIQRNATGENDSCSCRAGPIQMPSADGRIGIIYTEYRILPGNEHLSIGLSTREMSLDNSLGFGHVSYGYANNGNIRFKTIDRERGVISRIVPPFYTGDVVGFGLNWATRKLFSTKNGQRLKSIGLYVKKDTDDLYPTVSMLSHGDAVEANFGPNFEYDLSKEF